MTNIHHTIDYVELSVGRSMAETRAFYEQAFGWAFNDYGPEYAGIRGGDDGGEVGGLSSATHAAVGGPLVLLYSEDLDATVAAVRAAGGTVVEEPYEFPGGRRFHFADPAGNELGVWSSA
ncbi:VOC family protein [Nocardioides hankookensis]|uniref:VOC family protein n=1 Tax=Nocardioides hankookensis TaxID=443157 RepID=A0ABW1LM18_9ACTN